MVLSDHQSPAHVKLGLEKDVDAKVIFHYCPSLVVSSAIKTLASITHGFRCRSFYYEGRHARSVAYHFFTSVHPNHHNAQLVFLAISMEWQSEDIVRRPPSRTANLVQWLPHSNRSRMSSDLSDRQVCGLNDSCLFMPLWNIFLDFIMCREERAADFPCCAFAAVSCHSN